MSMLRTSVIALVSVFALTGCAPGSAPTETSAPEPVYVTAPLTGIKYEENSPEAQNLRARDR